MIVSSIVLAYHGCDRSVAEGVVSGKNELVASQNDYDWLGEGIYFWENSPRRALRWAQYLRDHPKVSQSKIKKPAVVGAVVELGNCLDLTDQVSLDLLKQAHADLKLLAETTGMDMPQNRQVKDSDNDLLLRNLDCAVINFCHQLRESEKKLAPFNTIRGVFQEGKPLFPGSQVRAKTHIQLAVRTPKNILGYFWPRNPLS